MMSHPMVQQLRFTRSEFKRALEGVNEEDASKRLNSMNCMSWSVGHLAWQEQKYFLFYAQGQMPLPEVDKMYAYGAPASTPSLEDMWSAWHTITRAVDPWLDTVTVQTLQQHVVRDGKPSQYIFGALLQRVIYHYWFHTGWNMSIRKTLGHTGLPYFVGDIDGQAPYTPE